ncbi:hypothetical protein M0805_007494 [Coniferiporia weirii]|nr:hypothetical protein M0805_007494 [Coniferiporia weirii]
MSPDDRATAPPDTGGSGASSHHDVSKDDLSEKELLRDILECLKQNRALEERDRDDSKSDKDRDSYSQLSSMYAVIAVFIASVGVSFLALAQDAFSGRPAKRSDQVVNAFWFLSVMFSIVSAMSLGFAASSTFITKLASIDIERYYELYKAGRAPWRKSYAIPTRHEPPAPVFKMAMRRILGMKMDTEAVETYVNRMEQHREQRSAKDANQPEAQQEIHDENEPHSPVDLLRNRESRVHGEAAGGRHDFDHSIVELEPAESTRSSARVPPAPTRDVIHAADTSKDTEDSTNEQEFIVMMTVISLVFMIPSLVSLLVGLMVFVWAEQPHGVSITLTVAFFFAYVFLAFTQKISMGTVLASIRNKKSHRIESQGDNANGGELEKISVVGGGVKRTDRSLR